MKKILLSLITISTIMFANDVFLDKQGGSEDSPSFKLRVEKTGSYYNAKGSLDLGLSPNLLEGFQKKIYKEIDDSVNPLIDELEDMKEQNMKALNTETYTGSSYTNTINKNFMKLIGVDDVAKATKDFKEKYKGGIGAYIFNNEKFSADTGGLNPFAEFNEKFKDKVAGIQETINSYTKVSDFVHSKLSDPIKDFDKYRTVDLKNIIKNTITNKDKVSASQQYLLDIVSGKNPSEAFTSYYKEAYPDYYPSEAKVSFTFQNRLPKTNNMCDITKCLMGDCSSLSGGEEQDLKDKAEKLRKALYQKAVLIMVQKLLYEFYIQEYLQFAQRAMACSVEASMAVTADSLGFGVPQSSGVTGTVGQTSVSTNGQAVTDSAKKTADCLRVDDQNSKTEDNLDAKMGINAQGEGIDFYGLTASIWEPVAVGGEVKMQTDAPVKEYADTEHANSCILEGKTVTWKNAYNTCMEKGETSQVKFNAELQLMINKLFEKLRKHKKVECKLSKEMAKTEKLNFSLLKYSDLIPSLIETEYNEKSSKGFMDAVAYIINHDIKISEISTDNQVCFELIDYSTKEGIKDKSCILSANDKSITLTTSDSIEDTNDKMREFCNNSGDKLLSMGNIKELIDQNIKENKHDFIDKVYPIISDINFCSNYFKESFSRSKPVFEKMPMDYLLTETLLEMKYRYEDEENFDQNMFLNYKETFDYMNSLSYSEKVNICENKNAYNTPLMLTGKQDKNNLDDIYKNEYIESAIGKYCNAFKDEIINKELDKAMNEYDTPALDLTQVNEQLKDVEQELLKYKGM